MTQLEQPRCPGPDCPMCSGSSCQKCGAGSWDLKRDDDLPCEHDSAERHDLPETGGPPIDPLSPVNLPTPIREQQAAEIVRRLRAIADHVEQRDYPTPMSFEVIHKFDVLTEIKLVLSEPWGG